MSKTLIIARNTYNEIIRQPIYGILLGVTALLIALSPAFTMFTLMNSIKMVKDMGLASMLVGGLFLSVLISSRAISAEIERRTALTVMSKPVKRFEFILGKYLGLVLAIAIAVWLLTLILLMTVRLGVPEYADYKPDRPVVTLELGSILAALLIGIFSNYFYDRSFVSSAVISAVFFLSLSLVILLFVGPEWKFKGFAYRLDWQLAKAALLVFFALSVLASLSVAASTRLNLILNISFCASIFILGLLSDYLFGRVSGTSPLANFAYLTIPNFQKFWVADALAEDKLIPLKYIGFAAGYAFFYQSAALSTAVLLFRERELAR